MPAQTYLRLSLCQQISMPHHNICAIILSNPIILSIIVCNLSPKIFAKVMDSSQISLESNLYSEF